MKWNIILLWLVGAVGSFGAIRIGSESAVTVPISAHYSTTMNVRPGMGETVTNNPPIFTWFYNTNHICGGEQNPGGSPFSVFTQTNGFQFQIATQENFGGTLAVDISTPFNFYNFLGPLDTNATRQFWWRVKYVTNGVAWFTNGIYTFTIANGATNWDRSMFVDSNYLSTNSVHPMFGFRAGEESNVWWHAQNDDARIYQDLLDAANAATNAAYFHDMAYWPSNATPHPKFAAVVTDGYTRANNIGAVLFLWKFSGDNRWTNASMTGWLLTNLEHNVVWFNNPSNNYPKLDYGDNESPLPLYLIIATYDWMFDYLGSDTGTFNGQLRTNALQAMRFVSRFWTYNDLWTAAPAPTGQLVLNYDWNYANRTQYCVASASFSKQGNSHVGVDLAVVMPVAWVGGQDDAEIGLHRQWMLNAVFARTTSFGGWAANHIGVYGYVDFNITALQGSLMLLDVAYPQAQVYRTEFCVRFPEWYARMMPYRKRLYHGAYGDGLPGGLSGHFLGGKTRGWDLSALTRSGIMRQAYDINREFSNTVWAAGSHFHQIAPRSHYTLPAATTNTPVGFYPEDGFAVASTKSSGEFDSYTNGVTISIKAAPRGTYQNHQIPDALSFDLSAYGAQVTDGGGGNLDDYGYSSGASPGLFVNGYGYGDIGHPQYGYSQTVPVEAGFIYFTNFSGGVYACADGTALFTNAYHPQSNIVTKVRRHWLFITNVESPFVAICDEFGTSSPATFGVRLHVPWAFRYDATESTLANETLFTGFRIGSNSLAMGANGYTFTAGNYADSAYVNPTRIPVQVQFANAVGQIGWFNATGTNKLFIGTNVVLDASATNSTFNPFLSTTYKTVNPDRAVGMWITNTTPATNFIFVHAEVPTKPGATAPTITRLSDLTLTIGSETVSFFETNAASTFIVDTSSASENPGAPGEESSPGSAILRGVIMRGAFVK